MNKIPSIPLRIPALKDTCWCTFENTLFKENAYTKYENARISIEMIKIRNRNILDLRLLIVDSAASPGTKNKVLKDRNMKNKIVALITMAIPEFLAHSRRSKGSWLFILLFLLSNLKRIFESLPEDTAQSTKNRDLRVRDIIELFDYAMVWDSSFPLSS